MISLLVFMLGVLCSCSGQDIRRCSKVESKISSQDVEVHCSCMEQLIEFSDSIYKLTVNQTDCPKNTLRLDWSTLQTYIGVKKLVFDHANVIFENALHTMPNYSVIELTFYNSVFKNISANSFKGLKLIETIRVVESEIDLIEAEAFSGFHHLKTIEFANSSINVVKSDAFFDLPLIDELAFIGTSIETLETNAIHIMNTPMTPKMECPTPFRSRNSDFNLMMSEVVGRSLAHLENVTLPPYGSKLVFFNSEVELLNFKSISTDNFAYIIFGGNTINKLDSKAINSVIQNDCDIGAIIFVGNIFKEIKPEAFIDITGSETNPFNTVFSMVSNIFYNVGRMGFLLDPKIKTSHVKDNKFSCSQCHQFYWLLSNEESEPQIRLERDLIEKGKCIDNTNLITFLTGCTDDFSNVTRTTVKSSQDFSSSFFTDTPNKPESMPQTSQPSDSTVKANSKSNFISLSMSLIILQVIVNCALFLGQVQKQFLKLVKRR